MLRSLTLLALLLAVPASAAELPLPPMAESFSAGDPSTVSARPWWESMDDARLVELVELGLSDSPDVASAVARLDQSRATAAQTASGLMPTVSASGTASWAPNTMPIMMGQDELGGTIYTAAAGVSAQWTLDIFGRQTTSWRASVHERMASEGSAEATSLALSTRIAQTWYDLVSAAARLQLLEEQVAWSEELLRLVELQYQAGTSDELDLLSQRQQVASTRTLVPQAEQRVDSYTHQLNVLLGREPTAELGGLPTELPTLGSAPSVGRPVDLLANRPDVAAAAESWEAAQLRYRSEQLATLPSLGANAGYDYNLRADMGDEASDPTEYGAWSVGLSVSVPLFQGGRQAATIRSSRAQRDQAEASFASTLLPAMSEVETAVSQEESLRSQLQLTEAQVAAATASRDAAQDRYLAGTADHLSLINASNTHLNAQLSLLQAHRDLLAARIDLHDALGGPWTAHLGLKD